MKPLVSASGPCSQPREGHGQIFPGPQPTRAVPRGDVLSVFVTTSFDLARRVLASYLPSVASTRATFLCILVITTTAKCKVQVELLASQRASKRHTRDHEACRRWTIALVRVLVGPRSDRPSKLEGPLVSRSSSTFFKFWPRIFIGYGASTFRHVTPCRPPPRSTQTFGMASFAAFRIQQAGYIRGPRQFGPAA